MDRHTAKAYSTEDLPATVSCREGVEQAVACSRESKASVAPRDCLRNRQKVGQQSLWCVAALAFVWGVLQLRPAAESARHK